MDLQASDRDWLRDWLAPLPCGLLTTQAADGALVSRPLQLLQVDAHADLWFFTGASSGKCAEIRRNARVNVAFADPASKRFASISGRAALVEDRARIDALWGVAQTIFYPRGRDDPELAVLRVSPETVHCWDGSESPWGLLRKFGKALLLHERSDLGSSVRLDLRRD